MLKFFLNSQTTSYLRGLESELGESSNSIRMELNRMGNAGLLNSNNVGNKKLYFANTSHPLYTEINSILKKCVGIDQIIERVTSQVGDLQLAYITGDFAVGKDSSIIDLALIGEHLDKSLIDTLVEKAEEMINRKIKYLVLTEDEMNHFYDKKPALLIWEKP